MGKNLGLILLFSLLLILPQGSRAAVVGAALCAVQAYPCPAGSVLDSGFVADGINLLPANTFDLLPFAFADAAVSFTGTMLATDVAGTWIYNWGSGTVTDILGGALVLDVAFQQTYVTVAGPASFNDVINGGCAGGTGANSGAIGQGLVNATGLSVLANNCSVNNPFTLVGTPVGGTIGNFTTLTAAAQFVFTAGSAAGSTITLPWGADFPDPDPGLLFTPDLFNLIDPNNIPNSFVQASVPEPGTLFLTGGLLCLAGLWRRRVRK